MKQILTLDSTQIDAFLTCPRFWYYGHKRRLTKYSTAPKDAMMMGTYGHKMLEIYYKSLASGNDISKAIDESMSFDPDQESCKNCGCDKDSHRRFFNCLTDVDYYNCTKCEKCHIPFEGKPFDLGLDERKIVKSNVHMYFMAYMNKDFRVKDPEAVELGFSHILYEDSEFIFILEGKIDLFQPHLNTSVLSYADHKFQTRRHDLYKKNIQFKNYALVTKASLAMVNYIRLTKSLSKDTFDRQLISFTPMDHQAWEARLIDIYKRIARFIRASEENELFWQTMVSEPNWASCSGKYGYECDYTSLCEEHIPQAALVKIDSMYRRREEWRPWQ